MIWDGLVRAYWMIVSLDATILDAALRTVQVSLLAVALATVLGLPAGTLLAQISFPGRRLLVLLCRAGMAVPTVFIGLFCFGIFSRRGPLGSLDLIYTSWAIVIGEWLLAWPIIVSISHGALAALDPRVKETALTLGAGPWRRWRTYLSEARLGLVLAVLTAFARCVTELGIAMMVGGNIEFRTRTLSTATALETSKGDFETGLAMGIILVGVALGVTFVIVVLGREHKR